MFKNRLLLLTITILFISMVAGCAVTVTTNPGQGGKLPVAEEPPLLIPEGSLAVHYIDVGQGDSILIELPTKETILIDAGERDKGEVVLAYLQAKQIGKIDFLIATHPHSDHIGGLQTIVENFDIGKVYMPRASHTTQTYENLLLSIKNKGLKITEAKAGVQIGNSDLYRVKLIAPHSSNYASLNDYSAALKLSFGENTFLFTGDTEATGGQEIMTSGENLKADFLDMPHHGSTNSMMSKEFLETVAPKIAAISVGADNSYGHPHKEILEMLNEAGIEVLRTDMDGNITIVSDGKDFTIKKNVSAVNAEAVNNSPKYIGNKKSKVLHLPACKNLPQEQNRHYFNNKAQALNDGYRACKDCQP